MTDRYEIEGERERRTGTILPSLSLYARTPRRTVRVNERTNERIGAVHVCL